MVNICFSLLVSFLSLVNVHEFHLSKCDINYDISDQQIQVSLHVFLDDFEATLNANEPINLFDSRELLTADSLIIAYVENHLKIKHDGNLQVLTYLGREISEDLAAGYFYFEASFDSVPEILEVQNEVLLPFYDDQQNILTIRKDGKKAFHALLENGRSTSVFNF